MTIQFRPCQLEMTGLLLAEQAARAAQLHVVRTDLESRSQGCSPFQYLEPPDAACAVFGRGVEQEIRVAATRAAPDPSAQLVELRETEPLGVVDDHGVGARDI